MDCHRFLSSAGAGMLETREDRSNRKDRYTFAGGVVGGSGVVRYALFRMIRAV